MDKWRTMQRATGNRINKTKECFIRIIFRKQAEYDVAVLVFDSFRLRKKEIKRDDKLYICSLNSKTKLIAYHGEMNDIKNLILRCDEDAIRFSISPKRKGFIAHNSILMYPL